MASSLLEFTDKEHRLAGRRVEEATEVFKERYAPRSGIESTNSGLKNRLGLGRLRVRGRGSVFRVLLHKVAGWNVLRAAASKKLSAWVDPSGPDARDRRLGASGRPFWSRGTPRGPSWCACSGRSCGPTRRPRSCQRLDPCSGASRRRSSVGDVHLELNQFVRPYPGWCLMVRPVGAAVGVPRDGLGTPVYRPAAGIRALTSPKRQRVNPHSTTAMINGGRSILTRSGRQRGDPGIHSLALRACKGGAGILPRARLVT